MSSDCGAPRLEGPRTHCCIQWHMEEGALPTKREKHKTSCSVVHRIHVANTCPHLVSVKRRGWAAGIDLQLSMWCTRKCIWHVPFSSDRCARGSPLPCGSTRGRGFDATCPALAFFCGCRSCQAQAEDPGSFCLQRPAQGWYVVYCVFGDAKAQVLLA